MSEQKAERKKRKVTVSRSIDDTIARYNYGLSMERAGHNSKSIAQALGYADIDSWRRLKSNYSKRFEGPKQMSIASKQRLERTRHAFFIRARKGLELEKNGMSEQAVAHTLGYSKTDHWARAKSQYLEMEMEIEQRSKNFEAKHPAPVCETDFLYRDMLTKLGAKALMVLSPRYRSLERANTILDALLDEEFE